MSGAWIAESAGMRSPTRTYAFIRTFVDCTTIRPFLAALHAAKQGRPHVVPVPRQEPAPIVVEEREAA